jgi:hypothetical protein
MTPSRFPCRLCGRSTDGIDGHVVCSDCVAEYEQHAVKRQGEDGRSLFLSPTDPMALSMTAGEMEARLRKPLDDW